MSVETIRWLIGLAAIPTISFFAWIVMSIHRTRAELDAFKLKVSEDYAKSTSMRDIDMKVDSALALLHEICGKLDIPVRRA